ncbi:sigma-54 dependent transcriptional regulator [Halalkalibacterium halodurans]|uniref:sigma-54-dependent transcriptional regulator n=1 Tax=Halalkalibacterium halodurans TaxID=86665 RepID=UPI002E22E160|nr:sigma-54 dependent transcriptional regulator [Halalkalibacterium halodurans]
MKRILIIDDEPSICSSLQFALEDDYETEATTEVDKGLHIIEQEPIDVVLLDLKIGKVDGLEVLQEIKRKKPETIVIMITAYGTIANSVKAIRLGAYSYLTKPIHMEELFSVLEQALHYKKLNEQVAYLSQELEKKYGYEGMIGKSEAMTQVFHLIEKVKNVDSSVLITGESGTGKELVARAIHFSGKRKQEHFEVVNCAAIPEHLLESELFGYEKGAFTGAATRKEGKFQLANRGTIFLDEIGDMPLALQAKLLRVLQKKEVTKLGSNKTEKLDVRVIAATNKSLQEQVKEGTFREDLYFRLHVIHIHLPPLRERQEDLPYLLQHFLHTFNQELGKSMKGFRSDAQRELLAYRYPGNIRELSNIVESSMVIADGEYIELEDLPMFIREKGEGFAKQKGSLDDYIGRPLKELEKDFILATLKHNDNHRKKTAEMLGISERGLRDKLKQYLVGKN